MFIITQKNGKHSVHELTVVSFHSGQWTWHIRIRTLNIRWGYLIIRSNERCLSLVQIEQDRLNLMIFSEPQLKWLGLTHVNLGTPTETSNIDIVKLRITTSPLYHKGLGWSSSKHPCEESFGISFIINWNIFRVWRNLEVIKFQLPHWHCTWITCNNILNSSLATTHLYTLTTNVLPGSLYQRAVI